MFQHGLVTMHSRFLALTLLIFNILINPASSAENLTKLYKIKIFNQNAIDNVIKSLPIFSELTSIGSIENDLLLVEENKTNISITLKTINKNYSKTSRSFNFRIKNTNHLIDLTTKSIISSSDNNSKKFTLIKIFDSADISSKDNISNKNNLSEANIVNPKKTIDSLNQSSKVNKTENNNSLSLELKKERDNYLKTLKQLKILRNDISKLRKENNNYKNKIIELESTLSNIQFAEASKIKQKTKVKPQNKLNKKINLIPKLKCRTASLKQVSIKDQNNIDKLMKITIWPFKDAAGWTWGESGTNEYDCTLSEFTGKLILVDQDHNLIVYNLNNNILSYTPKGTLGHYMCADAVSLKIYTPKNKKCSNGPIS